MYKRLNTFLFILWTLRPLAESNFETLGYLNSLRFSVVTNVTFVIEVDDKLGLSYEGEENRVFSSLMSKKEHRHKILCDMHNTYTSFSYNNSKSSSSVKIACSDQWY